ncbi:hypothetical protein SDC9_177047 [bioreactor metagenome]|uniref:Uncharacterized protein n=1 Tax=bioreactor metagenome TaxID=1076179 RepID=A0A645GZW7_9ZZZZ
MGQRQPQQRQRLERVPGRHLQRYAQRPTKPCDMAVGPGALGRNTGRSGVGIALQQGSQQHRAVIHVIAEPLQRLGHLLQRQPCIGRHKVQIKGDVLHVGSPQRVIRSRLCAGPRDRRAAAAGSRSADAARHRPWTRRESRQWF